MSIGNTVVLVTGATKGIGKGLVRHYAQRANTIVVAAVRDPSNSEAQALLQLTAGSGSKIVVVKIHSDSPTDAQDAVKSLVSDHGINHIDVVVANAGIFDFTAHQKIGDLKLEDLQQHIDVNAFGVIRLFQATLNLLNNSSNPIFLLNSAGGATMGGNKTFAHFPLNSYAASKLLANFTILRMEKEYPHLISFAVHPGSVVTENRTAAAQKLGVPVEGISVDECVTGLLGLLDHATLKTTSGTFVNYDGTPIPW